MYPSKMPDIYPAKRIFDVIFSLCVLTLSSPLIIFFLACIFIEHIVRLRPLDSLFYHEIRFSHGRPFTLYKFNIFKQEVIDAMHKRGEFVFTKQLEHNGSLIITGKVLRQIYLDELPQFFNIFKGDMSVVGPRPVNQKVHEQLLREGTLDKTKVRAGLTGNYQSHKYTPGASSDVMDKEYVEYYLSHKPIDVLIFDLKIMFRTVKVLLLAKGV